jgi:hypothetical protein
VRATIFQCARNTLFVTPKHERLLADAAGHGLDPGHLLGTGNNPPRL